jgi:hypothetical protein
MDHPVYSIVFDKRQADRELTPLSIDRMVLALLARQPPEAAWNECLVYEGETPSDPSTTKCVAMTGPCADRVQERLVETIESLNIPVLGVYDGGPEVRMKIARVKDGRWGEP